MRAKKPGRKATKCKSCGLDKYLNTDRLCSSCGSWSLPPMIKVSTNESSKKVPYVWPDRW